MSGSLHKAAAGVKLLIAFIWLCSQSCTSTEELFLSFHRAGLNRINVVLNCETTSDESSAGGTHTPTHTTQLDASPIGDGCSDAAWLRARSEKHTESQMCTQSSFLASYLARFSTTSKPGTTTKAISNHECALTHPFINSCLMTCWIVLLSFIEHGVLFLIQGEQGRCVCHRNPLMSSSTVRLLVFAKKKRKKTKNTSTVLQMQLDSDKQLDDICCSDTCLT